MAKFIISCLRFKQMKKMIKWAMVNSTFFYSSEATKKRIENNQVCLQTFKEKFDNFFRNINPFADSYLQMHLLTQDNSTADTKMVFMENKDLDLHKYIAPISQK